MSGEHIKNICFIGQLVNSSRVNTYKVDRTRPSTRKNSVESHHHHKHSKTTPSFADLRSPQLGRKIRESDMNVGFVGVLPVCGFSDSGP